MASILGVENTKQLKESSVESLNGLIRDLLGTRDLLRDMYVRTSHSSKYKLTQKIYAYLK